MTLYLLLTNKCNLSCKGCLNHSSPDGQNGLPKSAVKQILSWLAKQKDPVIEFTGGEPFLREDFEELVYHCRERAIALTLSTNCWEIKKSHTPLLKLFRRITLTVYGNELFHDSITNVRGSYCKNLWVLELLRNSDIHLKVNVVTMSEALSGYPALINTLTESGVKEIKFSMMLPLGRAKKLTHQLLTARDLEILRSLSLTVKSDTIPVNFQHLNKEPYNCRMLNKGEIYLSYSGCIYSCALLGNTRFCLGRIDKDKNAMDSLTQIDWNKVVKNFNSVDQSTCPALQLGIYNHLQNVTITNGCPPFIVRRAKNE